MKRIVTIVLLLVFVLMMSASCANQTVTIGEQRQENVQIVGGNRTDANEENISVTEQTQQINDANQNDANSDGSSVNVWIFALLLPICFVGIWLIYIIIKVYKNRNNVT